MSYIIKNSTQGAIVARLTDAGRRKLSEGKLNIGLFQIGDSEINYDCYAQQPAASPGLFILQAEHNAQNLNPMPEKNKGHVKYPLQGGLSSGDTFGPTIPQHQQNDVYNTATLRGFFTGTTDNTAAGQGSYTYFTANTGGSYTLSSNWQLCVSSMTGSNQVHLVSATTMCSLQQYSPVIGDLISVTYEFSGGGCSQLNYSAASTTLFYQVTAGNSNSAQTNAALWLTLDRNIPNFNEDDLTSSWLWHYDDCPDEFLKLAVYLNDVTVDNAPMWCFLDKDQTPIKVRSSRISPNQSTSKVFEASRIPEWFLKEEKGRGSNYACLVGPAGKNFLFTPNIIHKASKPVKGHRDAMFLFLRPTSVKLDDPLNSAEPRANVRDVKKYRLD